MHINKFRQVADEVKFRHSKFGLLEFLELRAQRLLT